MVRRFLLLVLAAFVISCDSSKPYQRIEELLGTFVSVTFYGDRDAAESASDEVFEFIQELHNCVNIYDKKSELSQLNASAFEKPVVCSELLWDILQDARFGYDISEGYFDVTSGPLMKLWGFHRKRSTWPTEKEVAEALNKVGLSKVVFDEKARSVFFKEKGMVLDFGGIAKGYALDRCKAIAEKYGIEVGLIDLGGNVYCFPTAPDGRDSYNVGIRHPRTRGLHDALQLTDSFVATSGDYERFVEIDGKRVTHIVNPKTGYPVEKVASVSVVTEKGVYSDIFSTAIFVGGKEISEKVVKKYPSTQYMIVGVDGVDNFSFSFHGDVWHENWIKDAQ
jgi:thiamine biosynthesis lipoprotein ApbE